MNLARMAAVIYRRTGTKSTDWGASGADLVDELNGANEELLAMIRGRSDNFYPTAWTTTDLGTGTATPVFDALFHYLLPEIVIFRYGGDNINKNYAAVAAEIATKKLEMVRFYGTRSYKIFTVTIATPGVFTRKQHALRCGDRVIFSTTGALPTGISANTWYYVISAGLAEDTFEISATRDGSAIATSGSQSGTQYFATDTPTGFGRRSRRENNK